MHVTLGKYQRSTIKIGGPRVKCNTAVFLGLVLIRQSRTHMIGGSEQEDEKPALMWFSFIPLHTAKNKEWQIRQKTITRLSPGWRISFGKIGIFCVSND